MRDIIIKVMSATLMFVGISIGNAQTSSVENLGIVTANQVSSGLGFNLVANADWQWAAAAAAGATHARIQCSWSTVEQQTAAPLNKQASTPYIEDPNCLLGFASARKYGIHPTVVAAYGAPNHQILTVTIPHGAPLGATSVDVQFSSGVGGDTLAAIAFPYDYLLGPPALTASTYGRLSAHGSYDGTFITGVKLTDASHATLSLASALIISLPAGASEYTINEILYPSAATTSPTDPSVEAFDNYVGFLARDMASYDLSGDIEIWNEPPWAADPWDTRGDMYDPALWPGAQQPGPNSQYTPNYGFVADLQHRTFPTGITATWNGTSGGGTASVLGTGMYQNTGEYLYQPSTLVTKESFHPYGITPEEANWDTTCLATAAAATRYPANNPYLCLLSGEHNTNFVYSAFLDAQAKLKNPAYGIGHSVTETGVGSSLAGLRIPQARFIMRQYLAYEGNGVTPVEFFELAGGGSGTDYGFVTEITNTGFFTPNPSYTALSGFMADIKPLSNLPVTAYSPAGLASVTSYTGTFPLSSVHMVGSRIGATMNSEVFAVWQRSHTACDAALSNCGYVDTWLTQPSPDAAPVTINIPSGMKVTEVVNLTTREPVNYTTSGQQITFNIADDATEVIIDPAADNLSSSPAITTTLLLSGTSTSDSYGSQLLLSASLSPYNNKTQSTNGEVVTFSFGSTLLGTGTLSSGMATLNVTSLPVGTDTVIAKYGGDKNFAGSVGYYNVVVTKANPMLGFGTIPNVPYGSAAISVSASSKSSGAITYSVLSGPARIAATTSASASLTTNAVGVVVLQANQVASTNYAAVTAQTSFKVIPVASSLAFRTVATQTDGAVPFAVNAYSNSSGSITYSVVSGPAIITGNIVTVTGSGTVTLQASQVAAGNYNATISQTGFLVNSNPATLAFTSIASQIFGAAPFTVRASCVSPGVVTYSVVSGPATLSGNIVTLTGAGTVVLRASQAASGKYAASAAQTSFSVSPAVPVLTFAPIPTQTFGASPFSVKAESTSPAAITYSVSGPASLSGNTVTLTGAGTITLRASQPSVANYAATTAQANVVVAQATPSLTFKTIASQVVGVVPFMIQASSASTGAITYSVISGPATLSGTTLSLTGAGTVILHADQVSVANYTAAGAQTSFLVNANTSTLTFIAIKDQIFGAAPFTIKANSDSPGAITYSVVSGSVGISGNTLTIYNIGPVVLRASQVASKNYPATTVQTSFMVSPTVPSLTFTPIASQTVGVMPFVVKASSASAGVIAYSVVSGPATLSGNIVTLTGSGTVVLRATQVPYGDYIATTAQISFVVNPKPSILAFTSIKDQIFGAVPFTVQANSAVPGMITYSVISGSVGISGNTLRIYNIGPVVLRASQTASNGYPATSAQTSFTVEPAEPKLIFTPTASQVFAGAPFRIKATSASAGVITYSVISGPATLSGNTLTLTSPGTVIIRATQVPYGDYTATAVQTSFVASL